MAQERRGHDTLVDDGRRQVTTAQKTRLLCTILDCSPAGQATTAFASAARTGDLASLWATYQAALPRSKHPRKPRAPSTEITLAMLEPAMTAVYELPTAD